MQTAADARCAMFEDALMESGGRIRTRQGWFSGMAALLNGSIVCLLVLWPLFHPASLPRQSLSMLLTAPAPPAPPLPPAPHVAAALPRTAALVNPFTPPRIVPHTISSTKDEPAVEDARLDPLSLSAGGGSMTGLPDSIGTRAMPDVHVAAPAKKPTISSGVMAGNKIGGAEPRYPAIAREAHVQGTVVLAATISKSGTIENLHVVSGPPLLAGAAVDAVRGWRYRPYLLNGEPVEVETTVRVVFNLGG